MGLTSQPVVGPWPEVSAELPEAASSLSAELRFRTAEAHRQVERDLGLPESIESADGYRRCLVGFYRLYRPLEAGLARFEQWASVGVEIAARSHTRRLSQDLLGLGIDPEAVAVAPGGALPVLSSFAAALGTLYVLEGSTLGARMILRYLEGLLSGQIRGASSFFAGHGPRTGESWREFQECLDRYGAAHPGEVPEAVAGANAAFRSIGNWMGGYRMAGDWTRHDQHR